MRVARSASSIAATACLAILASCGGSAVVVTDPQEPAPPPRKGQPLRPSQIVICPDGASYDNIHNTCLATASIEAAPSRETGQAAPPTSSISVRCTFRNGWVSVIPSEAYPSDDSFLMQALIGFSQEPDFWASQSEYSRLERYAARHCGDSAERFALPAGDYFVVVGESGAVSRRGGYDRNGYRRRVRLSSNVPQNLTIRQSDLTLSWSCISCPYVSFFDPATGRYLPAVVVLAYRSSPQRRGTDRVLVEKVPVQNGKIRLRVVEAEQEISHLDQLVVEVEGQVLLPLKGGKASALASVDGVGVDMSPGKQINVEYEVPGRKSGTVDVHLIAHGHYDPLL